MSDLKRTNAGRPGEDEAARGFAELGEDTTGFGEVELRTLWHTLRQPATVLEAYMTGGPTGGGLYSRPLRLYLTLCGFLMLVFFLHGGTDQMLAPVPPEMFEPLLARSGKSLDAFMADADGWMTLVMVPVLSAFYALFAAPLIRLWDPENLGWRRAFRATFAYLNTWTIPLLPFAWIAYEKEWAVVSMGITTFLAVVAFLRAGKTRWYATPLGGVLKGIALAVVMQLAGLIGFLPIAAIGILGGLYAA